MLPESSNTSHRGQLQCIVHLKQNKTKATFWVHSKKLQQTVEGALVLVNTVNVFQFSIKPIIKLFQGVANMLVLVGIN